MDKIIEAIESIANQRSIDPSLVHTALKNAYINTAKRVLGKFIEFDAILDEEQKVYRLYMQKEVVAEDDDRMQTSEAENLIALNEAHEINSDAEVGDVLMDEIKIEELFGRGDIQVFHQEFDRSLQKTIEEAIFNQYSSKIGKLMSGVVTRVDHNENTFIEMGEVRAILPRKNRIKGEKFKVGDTVKTIVRRVTTSMKEGFRIELSRTSPKFLEALMALEVPEIADGTITIERAARIPGDRAKVALYSSRSTIDAVGAAVGTRGMRINAVGRELNGESIDVIEYTERPEEFILRAMAPAEVRSVVCKEENKALVLIDSDQKAKAIGKSGVNIRLAAMLTGYAIELQEIEGSITRPVAIEGGETDEKSDDTSVLSALFNS
ncbi:MAG: transcription termination factor NusA [Helicobacteraceae bacterium]|jgi:N utilization substance protein A|nr:transcription termination factor NusA [Helicobacteraceae bacterium]